MRLEQRHRVLLEAIAEHDEPVNGLELADELGKDYTVVSSALGYLRRNGFVEYEDDGRQYLYHGRAGS